jgi:hypothetical protein
VPKKPLERERPRLTLSRDQAAEELAVQIKIGRDPRAPLQPMLIFLSRALEDAVAGSEASCFELRVASMTWR